MTYSINPSALARGVHFARRLVAEQPAVAAHSGGSSPNGSRIGGKPASFVMPHRPVRSGGRIQTPAPVRLREAVVFIPEQPTVRSDRARMIDGQVNGQPFRFRLSYEESRPHRADDPLPKSRLAARNLARQWPGSAQGTVAALGSRLDHRHAEKTYGFERVGDGLRVKALHRGDSDMDVLADGRIYLNGKEVTEKSGSTARQRVASRLNAATAFLEACHQTLASNSAARSAQVEPPAATAVASTQVSPADIPR